MPIRAYLILHCKRLIWCAFVMLLVPFNVVLFTASETAAVLPDDASLFSLPIATHALSSYLLLIHYVIPAALMFWSWRTLKAPEI